MDEAQDSKKQELEELLAQDKLKEALDYLGTMPDTPENVFIKAETLIKLDKVSEGEELLKLLDGVYKQDRVSLSLGFLYATLKRYPEAKYWLKEGAEVYNNKGIC